MTSMPIHEIYDIGADKQGEKTVTTTTKFAIQPLKIAEVNSPSGYLDRSFGGRFDQSDPLKTLKKGALMTGAISFMKSE